MTSKFYQTFIITLLLSVTSVYAAEKDPVLEEALRQIQLRNYSHVVELLTPLAQQGDSEAQYQLASLYRTGKRVTKDLTEAVNWLSSV